MHRMRFLSVSDIEHLMGDLSGLHLVEKKKKKDRNIFAFDLCICVSHSHSLSFLVIFSNSNEHFGIHQTKPLWFSGICRCSASCPPHSITALDSYGGYVCVCGELWLKELE